MSQLQNKPIHETKTQAGTILVAPSKEIIKFDEDGGDFLESLDLETMKEFFDLDDKYRRKHMERLRFSNVKRTCSGNPPKYVKEYCVLLIWHMSQGGSYQSFSGVLGVVIQTLYNWEDVYPAWKMAKGVAFSMRLEKWEKTIDDAAIGKSKGNAAAIIFALKNYFPDMYKDSKEINTNVSGNITVQTGVPVAAVQTIDAESCNVIGQPQDWLDEPDSPEADSEEDKTSLF